MKDRLHQFTHSLAKLGGTVANLFFPPQCIACNTPISFHGALCQNCWNSVEYITPPQCAACGFPFDYAIEGRNFCAQCIASPPPYTMARAVCRYGHVSSRLVTGLKYADKTYIAPHIGKWLIQAGREFLPHADIVAPVPLHPYRLLKRGYNQSALLAKAVAAPYPTLELIPQLLKRKRHTSPQTGLTQTQRRKNVRGAFIINPEYKEYIRHKHIVVVDDVMTTGATVHACTTTLLKNGAKRVDILTLGHTLTR